MSRKRAACKISGDAVDNAREAIDIVIVVLLNAGLGLHQEYRTDQSAAVFRECSPSNPDNVPAKRWLQP
jgi:hypothetical protein